MILSGTYTAAAITKVSKKFELEKLTHTEIIGCALIALQVLDALFTNLGMIKLGTNAEGNLLLKNLMELFGIAPALAFTKTIAVLIIWTIVSIQNSLNSALVRMLFLGTTAAYTFMAVIPWSIILFFS